MTAGTTQRWAPGSATTIGSLPGADAVEAARLLFGELTDLAHIPELPARGVGAEMIGRAGALLVDLPVEVAPSGWRLAAHDGRDVRRARDLLARDLDALAGAADGYEHALKLQATGPWTLAANVEMPSGHKAVSDHGATRELAESLAEGLRAHMAEVQRRVPAARLVLQLDEPSLPAVLAGQVPTPSGYGTVRAVDSTIVEQTLASVLGVAGDGGRAIHCCADGVPVTLLRHAGATAISLDASKLSTDRYDAVGEAVDAGVSLWLGVVPATDSDISFDSTRDTVRRIWGELGFAARDAAGAVVVTPACGLAGASTGYVRRVLSVLRDTGRALLDVSA